MTDAAPPALRCARTLVDAWASAGLREACLSPGSRSAPLALALHEHPAVRLHVRVDERAAGFTALGLAKATGVPALVTCTSGTAVANLHPAVTEAFHAGVGLLVVTADRPPELRHAGANQTIVQPGLFAAAVRLQIDVGVPEGREGEDAYWRSTAGHAWGSAIGGLDAAPGPVHLNLPLRDPLVGPSVVADVAVPVPRARTTPPVRLADEQTLGALADALGGTTRGLVLVGDVRATAAGTAALLALAGRLGWPVLAEPHSNARTGPDAISTAEALLGVEEFARAHRPDLLLVVGRPGLSRATTGLVREAGEVVVVDPDGRFLDPTRRADRIVVADLHPLATALTARLGGANGTRRDGAWWRTWRSAESRARAAVDAALDADDVPSEPRTARDLADRLPDGALLLAAASRPIRDLDLAMRPRGGLRVVANRGASGIDGLVSTAVGLALAHGGPTAALLGDLAFLHDHGGLLLGPEVPRPDLVLVVADNDGGGIFSDLEQATRPDAFEPLFATPHGLDLVAVARAAGWAADPVDRAGDLPDAVTEALATGGPRVLLVRTDRVASAALRRRLRAVVTEAVGDGSTQATADDDTS